MGALRFPGFGERLSAALVAAGYVRASGKLDVPAFLDKYGFDSRSFYPWVRGLRVPELDSLTRLADILGVTRAWLLLGDGEAPRLPSRGAPKKHGTLPAGKRRPPRGIMSRSRAAKHLGWGRSPRRDLPVYAASA